MSIVIYYLSPDGLVPRAAVYSDKDLGPVLARAESLRKSGCKHVSISSELSDSVGLPGVSEIVNGLLDDGSKYEWSKQRRGAGPRKEGT